MIELIVLFSASYVIVFAVLALALLVGAELVRRARTKVTGDDSEDDADPEGGAEDSKVVV